MDLLEMATLLHAAGAEDSHEYLMTLSRTGKPVEGADRTYLHTVAVLREILAQVFEEGLDAGRTEARTHGLEILNPYVTQEQPVEIRHCKGCGDDYNVYEESHAGHVTQEVPDA